MTGTKASKHIVVCLFAFWGTFLIVLILQCNVFTDGQLNGILLIYLSIHFITGHSKPMCALLSRLVRVEHVYATVLLDETMYARISKEIDKKFDLNKEQHLRNLIRYVYVSFFLYLTQ